MTVTHRNQNIISTQRDAWVEINLDRLERNYKKIKDLVRTNIMAVVKADAYGHGATTIAPILENLGVHSFGVATVNEGVALRKAKIKSPILILGATPLWAIDTCLENNLMVSIYSKTQLSKIIELNPEKLSCHLKIDTGMNRLGVDPSDALDVVKQISAQKNLNLLGVFSHLSDAENEEFSVVQKNRFGKAIQEIKTLNLNLAYHLSNSFGSVKYADFRYDLVRVGIALFGQEYDFLEPLMSVKGRITEVHKVKKGEFVSYERTWEAKEDSLIATIPIGYADGIDRKLSNKITASLKGCDIKQVGNITMDQMMFDISHVPDVKENDVITLVDDSHSIAAWAKELNTITYELVCRLKLRMPRVYVRD